MKKNLNELAIDALRRRIQLIAFDANLFDLRISDDMYSQECSQKRKLLNAELVRLGGDPKPLPMLGKAKRPILNSINVDVEQLSFDL